MTPAQMYAARSAVLERYRVERDRKRLARLDADILRVKRLKDAPVVEARNV